MKNRPFDHETASKACGNAGIPWNCSYCLQILPDAEGWRAGVEVVGITECQSERGRGRKGSCVERSLPMSGGLLMRPRRRRRYRRRGTFLVAPAPKMPTLPHLT